MASIYRLTGRDFFLAYLDVLITTLLIMREEETPDLSSDVSCHSLWQDCVDVRDWGIDPLLNFTCMFS